MDAPKKHVYFCKQKVIILSSRSKEDFTKEYKKFTPVKSKEFYLQVLSGIKDSIEIDNIDDLKCFVKLIDYINVIECKTKLKSYYDDSLNTLKSTNLIILACKFNRFEVIEYLFSDNFKIIYSLSIDIGYPHLVPGDVDEERHNAFYYAIRSGTIELMNTLINRWPNDYFNSINHFEELDNLMSTAYNDLCLLNVIVPKEMQIYVEDKLINLRFVSRSKPKVKINSSYIEERMKVVIRNIKKLIEEYLEAEENEKFIANCKFLVKNIYVLKHILKSSYDRIPWEEIEFCLVAFILSRAKNDELSFIFKSIINKAKLLKYLNLFVGKLEIELKHLNKHKYCQTYPLKERRDVMRNIIEDNVVFADLYRDFEQIRDMYCLKQIEEYINIALNIKNRELELLIIERTLLVIGENLKSTLISPKLSHTVTKLLFASFSEHIKKWIEDLQASSMHSFSLYKRIELHRKEEYNFPIKMRNDFKKILKFVVDIFYKKKMEVVDILIEKLSKTEDLKELNEIGKIFSSSDSSVCGTDQQTDEQDELKQLVEELSVEIKDKTSYEMGMFAKMNEILCSVSEESKNTRNRYMDAFLSLKILTYFIEEQNTTYVEEIKSTAKSILNTTEKTKSKELKEVSELVQVLTTRVKTRKQHNNNDKINHITHQIYLMIQFYMNNTSSKAFNDDGNRQPNSLKDERNRYGDLLEEKLYSLRNILISNSLSDSVSINTFVSSNKNHESLIAIEMLVIDILSIVEHADDVSKMTNNLLFIDDIVPILVGKQLRNHLAHGHALEGICSWDLAANIVSNAIRLVTEDLFKGKYIGKWNDVSIMDLDVLNKGNMTAFCNKYIFFSTIENNNMDGMKRCMKNGVDVFCRDADGFTALHYAAKVNDLAITTFLLNEGVTIDANNAFEQTPLHFAAAFDNTKAIEFYVQDRELDIDCVDYLNRTPLHVAASNGCDNAVKLLLKFNASTDTENVINHKPIQSAVKNNHISTVNILLKQESHVDSNKINGGYTLLHFAAEKGFVELVDYFLKNKANVNAKTYVDWTPLHAAALKGHLPVVRKLIAHKANVNAEVKTGCTPLHYAIEKGHEDVAKLLMKHGAKANVYDNEYYNTPLHYAARDGLEGITEALLRHGASVTVTTCTGATPLHYAGIGCKPKIVQLLLKYKADVQVEDKNKSTPLHYAASNGSVEIVELLVKNNARLNAKDKMGITPMFTATIHNHIDIIKVLLTKDVDVNSKDLSGKTMLHIAAANGNENILELLLIHGALPDARDNSTLTPLHVASLNGHAGIAYILLRRGADINKRDSIGNTALHIAAVHSQLEVIKVLISAGANVNIKVADLTALELHINTHNCNRDIMEVLILNSDIKEISNVLLCVAIKLNFRDIVELLINEGVDVSYDEQPLIDAVIAGYTEIVKLLHRQKEYPADNYNEQDFETSLLHIAASHGHKDTVDYFISNGCEIDKMSIGVTALFLAAEQGHLGVVKLLIERGADVNFRCTKGVALHTATSRGYINVVKLLLNMGADIAMTINNGWTSLHIAAQEGNLELVKYLIDEGADLHAKNDQGTKAIHVAAGEGHKHVLDFFINKGSSIDELESAGTPLHYAVDENQFELVQYLIEQGADLNVQDSSGKAPLHLAVKNGFRYIVDLLINNGAYYNIANEHMKTPLEIAEHKDIIQCLSATKSLFAAVRQNKYQDINDIVKDGAFVNAKDYHNNTALHHAAWKGYDLTIKALLKNKTNPDIVGKNGCTALHYAAKSSQIQSVKVLLSYGARYNATGGTGKTSLDFTEDKDVKNLLQLVNKSFNCVQSGKTKIVAELKKIKDLDTLKAVVNARNLDNMNLVDAAIHYGFPEVEELKYILQDNLASQLLAAKQLFQEEEYDKSIVLLKDVWEKRKDMLGDDNPATIEIQLDIGKVLYNQAKFTEALAVYEEIFQKQREIFGKNNQATLNTQGAIALILHRQGKNDKSLKLYETVFQKQSDLLGAKHYDTVTTQFHMALVLDKLSRYEEALTLNKEVYEIRKKMYGAKHPVTLSVYNNIGMVLSNQGNHDEAVKVYQKVFEMRKQVLGVNHPDTLRTLHNMSVIQISQHKYEQALTTLNFVYELQRTKLGPDHRDTLHTQCSIGNVLFKQGQHVKALEVHKRGFHKMKSILGPDHPDVKFTQTQMQISESVCNSVLRNNNGDTDDELTVEEKIANGTYVKPDYTKELFISVKNSNIEKLLEALVKGAVVNSKDDDGVTPLHYAVDNGGKKIVEILLRNGADVTKTTKKGNTPLHTAVVKNNKDIIEILLQNDKIKDFINAVTNTGGTTALHVATRNGSYDIVKDLLAFGAVYCVVDKSNKKTPLEYSNDQNITALLTLIDELFECARKGDMRLINKLKGMKKDELLAITNACNKQKQTLIQVALKNKHKDIATSLLKMLQEIKFL